MFIMDMLRTEKVVGPLRIAVPKGDTVQLTKREGPRKRARFAEKRGSLAQTAHGLTDEGDRERDIKKIEIADWDPRQGEIMAFPCVFSGGHHIRRGWGTCCQVEQARGVVDIQRKAVGGREA